MMAAMTANVPARMAADQRTVERGFWKKLLKVAGRIPFAEDLAAAYYCAFDPATPARVKAMIFAALAYFVVPVDAIPDFMAGLGYTDDATLLAAVIGLVARHITEEHRKRARASLGREENG